MKPQNDGEKDERKGAKKILTRFSTCFSGLCALSTLQVNSSFLSRNVNEGMSGGEKKRNEILQLAVLDADLAILDEIDSGN